MIQHKTTASLAIFFSLALCPLLVPAVGCSHLHPPKIVTQEGITPQIEKRNEEATRLFEEQRDFAEYEGAKARWEQQRDAKGCREELEKLLSRNPKHRDARLLLVELLLTEEDASGAYSHAKAALDLYPNDGKVQHAMGMATDALGKNSDALAYYERAAKMSPQNAAYRAAYQSARETAREKTSRGGATSHDILHAAAELESEETSAGFEEETLPDAPVPVERADSSKIADDSGSSDSSSTAHAIVQGDSPISADAKLGTVPEKLILEASSALRANQPAKAVQLLAPAAKQYPSSAKVHRMLGVAYYRQGDLSQVAFQQALSLDKSSALSYLLMGYTLAKLGKTEAAESHFRQARSLDPRYGFAR